MEDNPRQLWEHYREKIAEARDDDFRKRAEAWVEVPHTIAGTTMPPMSLRKLIYLEQIDSPLLKGENADHEDVVTFLWICSDKFTPREAEAKAFRKSVKKLPETLEAEISEYINDNLSYMAQGGEDGSPATEHFAASVIDLLASQYGWNADIVLDLPLGQMFQLMAVITKRLVQASGGTYIGFNPASDKLKAEYLKQVNGDN